VGGIITGVILAITGIIALQKLISVRWAKNQTRFNYFLPD
jgi:hypothetical protein